MRLRYIGTSPVTFVDIGVEMTAGDEFYVPDNQSAGYLVRDDIEMSEEDSVPVLSEWVLPAKSVPDTTEASVTMADPDVLSDQVMDTDSTVI